ncbi:helix-turn-helix domain-containing protein [Bdellovibrio sp. BCCA]|uniref:helix-turn-helix domain-containing protein n=1 Tax=Bdellovibrio sp. BCCA TaxID=3136281 RepID=UPI0030F02F80
MKSNKSVQSFKDFLNELDPTPLSPGRTCRAFRTNFDLTLQDVSDVTGIQITNLSALENEKIEMSSYYAEKLAAFFGIHPSLLLYPQGFNKSSEELRAIAKRGQALLKKKIG